jgi:membrane-associated phospholipid phosphatase
VPVVVLAALACAFLLLALLVETGVCAVVDRFSIAHLMPGRPELPTGNWLDGLYLPFGAGSRPLWATVADLVLYPCSVVVSALLLAAGALVLQRRGRDRLAAAFVLAWAVGNGIELVGKGTIRRPALYAPNAQGVLVHLRTYDASFPSGHTIRGALVAALLVALWPRARRLAAAWYATVAPLLVLTAAHTVVDVLGGLLVGAALVGALSRVGFARSAPDPLGRGARVAAAVDRAGA